MKKPLNKEEFLEKLKTDRKFKRKYGKQHFPFEGPVLPPCHYGFQVWTRELTEEEKQEIYFINHPDKQTSNKFISDDIHKEILNGPQRGISLSWNQRSVDTPLGLPFNIASYGILLHLIGKIVNMVPEDLIGNLGDTHIYQNQIDGVKEQLKRGSAGEVPTLRINSDSWISSEIKSSNFASINTDDFVIENYVSHGKINFPLSN